MPFLKRLGYFLAGLSVGLVILAFLLKKKTTETGSEFCYFPNCRVLKDLRSKPLTFSDAVEDLLTSNVLDSTDIQYFLEEGAVDFSKSDTKSVPCKEYLIEGKLNEKEATLLIKNCENSTIVESIEYTKQ
jgi:hypothetical protein